MSEAHAGSGIVVQRGSWLARAGRRLSIRHSAAVGFLFVAGLAGCDVPTGLPRVDSTFLFPVESVQLPVSGVTASATASQDFSDIDVADRVMEAAIRVTPRNPSGATGTLTVKLTGGGVTVTGSVNIAGGPNQRIPLTQEQVRALMGAQVQIEASGTLCKASGCGFELPPWPMVTLDNDLEVVVQLGGEG